jgi:DNA-binding GntR family transcriptional regulator
MRAPSKLRAAPSGGNGTRAERLREAIEELIATAQFPPGMRLDETELAARFSVSRTPLREALFQLASMGIVTTQPRRGAIVALVTPQRLLEMFDVMAELEAMCGRLAARRMSPEEHKALAAAHKACEKARNGDDSDTYYHANEHFHYLIYEGSHNAFLTEQTKALHRRLRPYRRLQLRVRNRVPASFREHQAVVDAILAGDSELTARRLREHVLVQGERFADLIASLENLHAQKAEAALARTGAPRRARPTPAHAKSRH